MELGSSDAISSALSQQTDNNTSGSEDVSPFSRQEFMKILTSQLQNQNPLDPVKQKQFIGQLTGLQNLEVLNKLSDVVGKMKKFQQLSSASSFIDKKVEGQTAEGQKIEGTVKSVNVEGSNVMLQVDNFKVPVDNVTGISS